MYWVLDTQDCSCGGVKCSRGSAAIEHAQGLLDLDELTKRDEGMSHETKGNLHVWEWP